MAGDDAQQLPKITQNTGNITAGDEEDVNQINSGQEFIYHTIKSGETLWDIVNQYKGVTVDQIKKLNNITDVRRLQPGQKLKIARTG
jgi:membrane-bound lytic murein transglycosylase D